MKIRSLVAIIPALLLPLADAATLILQVLLPILLSLQKAVPTAAKLPGVRNSSSKLS